MSSWNFDVAALKAEAEADSEPLPTIPETSYDPAVINAPRGTVLAGLRCQRSCVYAVASHTPSPTATVELLVTHATSDFRFSH